MKLLDLFHAFLLVTSAREHIKNIQLQLEYVPYDQLVNQDHKLVTKKQSAIAIAKAYFWASRTLKKGNCLPRSIAMSQYLKASGYEVNHRIGVNKSQGCFSAHSWVEYKNNPLNEHVDLHKRFTILENKND